MKQTIVKLSNLKGVEFQQLVMQIYEELKELESEYPMFKEWYYLKVIPEVEEKLREIYVIQEDNDICGIMILKNGVIEKKICTLRVGKAYQKRGIGTLLLILACSHLQTKNPLITVSSSRLSEFKDILKKNGFGEPIPCINYYGHGKVEYCYNGVLKYEEKGCLMKSKWEKVCNE